MIIAVSNQKGGCGKTTTAINLASSFAAMGRRTLLMDLDPQAHAGCGVGLKSEEIEYSLYNVLTERPDRKQFLESVIRPLWDNLDIAPSHVLLSTIEQEFVDKDQAVGKLRHVLEHMAFPYEFVLIDCPPSLGFLTFNALCACDLIVIPVDLGTFSLMGVVKLLSMIELIRVKMNHTPRVYALPTLTDFRSLFAKRMLEEIRGAFKQNMFQNFIHMNVACREAQALGLPVRKHKPQSKAALDYDNLAKEIMQLFEFVPKEEETFLSVVDRRRTVHDFAISAPSANGVYVVGDFNDWSVNDSSKLMNIGRGTWQKRLSLTPGKYRYRFVIDGKWIPDPTNSLAEPNPYGGVDSVLEIV